jgi:hypothetical protein
MQFAYLFNTPGNGVGDPAIREAITPTDVTAARNPCRHRGHV